MTPEQLTALRQQLHRIPEVSGAEERTGEVIAMFLRMHDPDAVLTGLGGHGVAAVYQGAAAGPTVLIRCELDGLPIPEANEVAHRSVFEGQGHLCGHDGHMAMVAALAAELQQRRPARGRVVLLFQPAEETGQGAKAVLADPRFANLIPDYAFALHNLPGLPLGHVALCPGEANCASRGMRILLSGRTSHAAAPQDGVSPATALAQLLPHFAALGPGGELGPDYALSTVTHCHLGAATFGIAPGEAELWVTLRALSDGRMSALMARGERLVAEVAHSEGLRYALHYEEVFDACHNDPDAVAVLSRAFADLGCPADLQAPPQRWSEDFGQFARHAKTAMFWLGAGEGQPQLHNPDYYFPDAALPLGRDVFHQVIRQLLG